MGLDMYLYGRKADYRYIYNPTNDPIPQQDGFPIAAVELSLGYWRKHSDLHGFIVANFADGVDECQRIEIGPNGCRAIIAAIKAHELPATSGFFFGRSARKGDADPAELEAQDVEDLAIWEPALAWLESAPEREERQLIYQASW